MLGAAGTGDVFLPLSSLGLVMRSLLPFQLFLCPPLRTGSFPEAPHQACSEFTLSTRAGCWHSAVPAAQGAALRPPPASHGCSPPLTWGAALPSWQPGRVDKVSVCPSARVGTAAQKCTSRAASGSAGLREPRALLPCAACASWGCPTSEVVGTGPGAACLAGACWLRHRHQLFRFPPGNCFCQYFNFIWAAQERRRWRRHIPSRSFVTRPALGGGPAQG